MKKIIEFLTENSNGYLATAIDNQPFVRVFQFNFEKDGRLYFVTSDNKPVYKQLKSNPLVEYCSMSKDFSYVRIKGRIGFSDSIEYKKQMLENSPMAKSIYKTADNPILKIVYIEKGEAVYTKSPNFEQEIYSF